MRRTSPLLLTLPDERGTLHRRLFRRMRALILDGSWAPGARLPSSRALAAELGISRNTALHAIELLIADGWAEARRGSAVYACDNGPRHAAGRDAPSRRPGPRVPVPFEMARQSAEFFPVERWRKLQSELWANADALMLYGDDSGSWPALCRAIADHVGGARGLTVSPDQVIIVSSTQEAIDLIARTLGRKGDEAWIEDPSYPYAHQVFRMNGIVPVPVPVDGQGLQVTEGRRLAPQARFACVTPTCHFPSGRVMSRERRLELIAWAQDGGSWIVEDDWEWHAHFDGAAPPPLMTLPGSDRTIYLQTFNRTIFPGLRLAVLIAPPELTDRLLETRQLMGGWPNVPVQATLARFLDEGLFAAHLRTSHEAYAERRAALIDALGALPPGYRACRERAGLHLVVETPLGVDDEWLAGRIRGSGIACMALSEFALSDAKGARGLVLGFAAFPPEELVAAAEQLVALVRAA